MDRVDIIIKNLEYQKKYLYDIYNEYIFSDSQETLSEVAITNMEDEIEVNKNLNIVIFCDEFNEILKELFYFHELNLEDYEEVLIKKSYINSYHIDGHKITLNLLHPYLLRGSVIKLIKKINMEALEDVSLLISLKKINLFNRKLISKTNIRDVAIKDLNELKEILNKFKATYYEEKFIDENIPNKGKKEFITDNNMDFNGIKVSICLDFIKEIIECKEGYLGSLNLLEKSCKEEFKKVSNNIIKDYINLNYKSEKEGLLNLSSEEKKKLFSTMYYLVNILLEGLENLANSLNKIKEELLKVFENFDNNLSKSEKYIKIMESNISEFDEITSNQLNDFKNKIINLHEF
ncbi:hypothetical protein P6O23_07590 [Clostridium perfringens]|nr:hypothetical protein [Clostridium perfringens]MDM0459119.1 hypothetical protein [Clostridium perfringens]